MYASATFRFRFAFQIGVLIALFVLCTNISFGQAQSNAADLRGYVRDQQGAVVTNAAVTARNTATNIARAAITNDEGLYEITNLPPGSYDVTIEASNFKKASLPAVQLTIGQRADLDVTLEPGSIDAVVTISGATTELVETSKTAIAATIDQQRIDNLPINERNYLSFALTPQQSVAIMAVPLTSADHRTELYGQRGRSNLVQVDGADNTDNSVNASRSTVSQEACRSFR